MVSCVSGRKLTNQNLSVNLTAASEGFVKKVKFTSDSKPLHLLPVR